MSAESNVPLFNDDDLEIEWERSQAAFNDDTDAVPVWCAWVRAQPLIIGRSTISKIDAIEDCKRVWQSYFTR